MKDKDGTGSELTGKRVSRNNSDVVVFAIFLFLSFIFWYLNSLGKQTETAIRLPLTYTNPPKDKVIINESKLRLNLYLKGSGSSILKLKLSGEKTPVAIDISRVNYKRVPGSKSLDYYIVTSSLIKSLSVQLRSGCEITSIKPDTLFFTLEKGSPKPIQGVSDNIFSGRIIR